MRGRLFFSALAVSAGLCSAAMADVTGKAVFDGEAPKRKVINMAAVPQCAAAHANPVLDEMVVVGEGGALKNVVVYVKDGAALGGAVPKEPVVLDQKGCLYVPHVVSVMVGQQLKAKNSDAFLHNVHGLAKDNGEFNFPQQNAGQEDKIDGTKAVETYKVKCDVHPWMSAWVVVLDHPFSGTTGDNGEFTIKGVKDGKYTLVAWHERLGVQEAAVEVKDGKAAAPVEFKFKPKAKPAAAAEPEKTATPVLVSAPAKKDGEACPECEKGAKTVAAPVAAK
jgi:plastocyanin